MKAKALLAAAILSMLAGQAKADPVTAIIVGGVALGAVVSGTVIYDEFTPKSQHCFTPSPGQRVCKIVKDSELEERIAEAAALMSSRTALAGGYILK